MKYYHSIIFKICVSLSVVLVLTYSIYLVYNFRSVKSKAYQDLKNDSYALLNRLQFTLVNPMWNLDVDEGNILVSLEMNKKIVTGIRVRQKDGRIFVSKRFDVQGSMVNDSIFNEKSYYAVYDTLIRKEKDTLGLVSVFVHDSEIKKAFLRELISSSIVSFIQIGIIAFFTFILIRNLMTKPLNAILIRLKDIARGKGDLTKRLIIPSRDEIGLVAEEFNTFIQTLQEIVHSINERVAELLKFSNNFAQSLDSMASTSKSVSSQTNAVVSATDEATLSLNLISKNSDNMSESVQMVTSAIEEISSSFNEVSRNCITELEITVKAGKQATITREIMSKLESTASEITNIVNLINDISGQINLLALNATIEAASAGEAGKGFSVVANEVKALAKKTAQSTEEIERQVNKMYDMTHDATKEIGTISSVIEDLNAISQSISAAVEEQSLTANEIAKNSGVTFNTVSEITQNVKNIAGRINEISSSIQSVSSSINDTSENISQVSVEANDMEKNTEKLEETVKKFKV